ncbi:hypothetical protein ACQZ6C_10760 [Rhizobium rhizogenes]
MLVVDATQEDIDVLLGKKLRQDDIDEWFAASGGRPTRETLHSILTVPTMASVRSLRNDDGECICLWGVNGGQLGEGLVWLIASEEAEDHGKHIHRYWPREVAMMHMHYALLVAIAYGNNSLHLDWLRAIGFKPIAIDLIGPGQLPFITHIREMPCVIQ